MTRITLLVTIVSLTLTGVLMAAEVRSQDMGKTPITLNIKNSTVADMLGKIEQQSGFTFSYSREVGEFRVSKFETENKSLSFVLKTLGAARQLTYTQLGALITIRANKLVQPGKITGKVLDEKGVALPGATIKVLETGQGTQSNVEGSYQFNLAPGTYTLEISYISYQTRRVTGIVVGEGKNVPLDIAMIPASKILGGVVISGDYKRSSTEGLYARQKNNIAITDGISADQISRTPDKNIGEVLKRISGVNMLENKYVVVRGLGERYNGTMMNGQLMPSTELNRKQFSFDIIPSNLVDNITIYKTINADKSAEFGGGLVEVNTKSVPTENSFSITFGESYNDKTTGKNFRSLKIDNSSYLGAIPGYRKLFGRSNWQNTTQITNYYTTHASTPSLFNNNWKLHNYTPTVSPNFQASFGHVIHLKKNSSQLGFIASLSYRNTWQTSDVLSSRNGFTGHEGQNDLYGFTGQRYGFTTNLGGIAGIGYTAQRFKISWQSTYLRTYDQQLVFGMGPNDARSLTKAVGYFDLTTQTSLLQNQLNAEKRLGNKGIKLDALLSYTVMDRQRPDNHQLISDYAGSADDNPNLTDVDFSVYNVSAGRNWNRSLEKNLGWNLDLTVPVKFNILKTAVNNSFKTGYAGWRKDRSFWVLLANPVFPTADAQPLSQVFDPALHPDGKNSINQFGDDYHRTASMHAGYVMLDSKIGNKFRLIGGVRGEYYNMNIANVLLDVFVKTQKDKNKDVNDYSDVYGLEPSFNLFPSGALTYALTDKMNLRLSYAKSIIRPDLRELSYFSEYDFELGGKYQSQTPVRSTRIDNYDFRYEWYPNPGDILSFSLFSKKLIHPMEIYDAGNNTYELRNDASAKNKGIEFEVRKSLGFTGLPVIKNFTLYGNFTRLFAKVTPMTVDYLNSDPARPNKVIVTEKPGAEVDRPQAGASNYTYNAGLYYDSNPVSVSLSYNYVTNRVFRAAAVYQESLFETPLPSLDAQLTYKILRNKGQVKLNFTNLLNTSNRVYKKRDRNSTTLLYRKGDFIDYQASPGRTYGLSFTYNF